MNSNLFFALAEEHRERTGHDINRRWLDRSHSEIACNVCMWLRAEKNEMDKAEKEYYEQLQKEAKE